ncbi:Aste57867_8473 [Aphanomyces stellatus]|uniref:Aste57867_8473 protein n=1 Tax=Aphanomyces stellatus TaxID=120398 RepID=A0A485KKC8_9STRA|nr:hypothetical protein As57867_008441 [Aphanomyces stellatus]VFT85359.1 Aste57867_8473 [Aphanomyces stellatus]
MHPRSDAGTRATDEMSWTDIVLTDTVSDLRESLLSHAGPPIEDRRRVQPTYLLWVFALAVVGMTTLSGSQMLLDFAITPSTSLLALLQGDIHSSSDDISTPNSSHGPRLEPPNFDKIMSAIQDKEYNPGLSPISRGSPYGSDYGYILNPGQPRVVVALGDSHLDFTKPRFVKLFDDAAAANNASFPTIVFKQTIGTPVLACTPGPVDANLAMIHRVQPQVVFVSFYWWKYVRPEGAASDPLHQPPPCCSAFFDHPCRNQSPRDAVELVRIFQDQMTSLTAAGIRVFVAGVNVDGMAFDPKSMVSGGDVGMIDPVSRASFEKKRAFVMGLVEPAVAAAGATLINYSDNMCDDDVCQVVDSHGVPIMNDNNHFTTSFARAYLSVLDQVVAAAMKSSK